MDVAADKLFAQELRKLLQSSFAAHRCLNAQQCANLLEISVRSMQRRLQALDLQFSTLVDEVRYDLARDKLLNSSELSTKTSPPILFSETGLGTIDILPKATEHTNETIKTMAKDLVVFFMTLISSL